MTFEKANLKLGRAQVGTNMPDRFYEYFSTADELTAIRVAGYFNEMRGSLAVGNFITVTNTSGGDYAVLKVTSAPIRGGDIALTIVAPVTT